MSPTIQIATATDLPQAGPVAAPLPATHGNRVPVERGTTAAPDVFRGEWRLGLYPPARPVGVHHMWWRP